MYTFLSSIVVNAVVALYDSDGRQVIYHFGQVVGVRVAISETKNDLIVHWSVVASIIQPP